MPAILVSLKGFRSALLKFFESFYRFGQAFASRLYSQTHRLLGLIRALFLERPNPGFKEVDEHNGPSLALFSSTPLPPLTTVSMVGCNPSPSDRLRSTPRSKPETEEDSLYMGRLESTLEYEGSVYESAIECENSTEPAMGAVDTDDELPSSYIQCENSDQEHLAPGIPALVEGEDQFTETGRITAPSVSHIPRRGQPRIRGTVPSYLQRYDFKIEMCVD